nr:MAG TPA: hypothetical protein [Caudoviricetes sp.]
MTSLEALLESLSPAMELDLMAGGDTSLPPEQRTVDDTGAAGAQSPDPNGAGGMDDEFGSGGADDFGNDDPADSDGMDGGDDPTMGGDPTDPMTDNGSTSTDTPNELEGKNNLRIQAMTLSDVVDAAITRCHQIEPPKDDDVRIAFYEITKRLDELKSSLQNFMVEVMPRVNYVDCLRRFTAMNKVFDLMISAIDKLIPEVKDEDNKSKNSDTN